MAGTCSKNNGRLYRYYRCQHAMETTTGPKNCNALRVRADAIEAWAWDKMVDTILHPEALISRLKSEQSGKSVDAVSLDADIAAIKKRLNTYDDKKRRLLDLFTDQETYGKDNLLDAVARLNAVHKADEKKLAELTATRERIASLANIEIQITEYSKLMRENLPQFTFEDKRNALDALDIHIIVSGDDWTINGFVDYELKTNVGENEHPYRLPFTFTHVHADTII